MMANGVTLCAAAACTSSTNAPRTSAMARTNRMRSAACIGSPVKMQECGRRHGLLGATWFRYRYQITKNGERVGSVTAEYHGRAAWTIDHPDFVDPGEP